MEWDRIRKRPQDNIGANLLDYDEYAKTFSWVQARAFLVTASTSRMRRLIGMSGWVTATSWPCGG